MTVPRPTLAHAARDSKLVLALVIVALLAAVVALSLTHHAVPEALNAAVVGAVGSLAGVSVPTHALTSAEDRLETNTTAQDVAELRRALNGAVSLAKSKVDPADLENVLRRLSAVESTVGYIPPTDTTTQTYAAAAPFPVASPLPESSPAS